QHKAAALKGSLLTNLREKHGERFRSREKDVRRSTLQPPSLARRCVAGSQSHANAFGQAHGGERLLEVLSNVVSEGPQGRHVYGWDAVDVNGLAQEKIDDAENPRQSLATAGRRGEQDGFALENDGDCQLLRAREIAMAPLEPLRDNRMQALQQVLRLHCARK